MKVRVELRNARFNRDLLEVVTCGLVVIVVAIVAAWFLSTQMFVGAFP